MKNLIQFGFISELNFYNYLQTGDLEKLIKDLRRIELLAMDLPESTISGSLWFKFSSDDTLATTIEDIKRDLSLPSYHNNHMLLVEKIKNAIDLNGELKVYFS